MTAVAAGLGSVPMVFDYNLVLLFNEIFVTAGEPLPTLTWAVASRIVASLYESKMFVCMYVFVCVSAQTCPRRRTWRPGWRWAASRGTGWSRRWAPSPSCCSACSSPDRSCRTSVYLFIYVCMYVERSRSLVDSWHCSVHEYSLFFLSIQ